MVLTTRTRKIVLGVSILLIVDVIWVLSNELTKVTEMNHLNYCAKLINEIPPPF